MAHLPGGADEIRARVPAVLEAWEYMRDNVLRAGVVEPELKELCFHHLAGGEDTGSPAATERQRLALRWADAIVWDAALADDELWAALHAEFTEPELVELGCAIGFELGQQHFRRTLGLPPRD
ncbi:MAG: carboxymuconolactone decarboxylase family protein [Gaiellaceae bacterium]